ncbi:MAG: MATE family efflux transporter [Treponema sp.]
MEIEKIKLNKTKSILQFGIPATIGMLMTSLITIVDGYFAGNYIGSQALVAINLGLPLLYFYLAIGLMIGVGGSVISGIAIGSRDRLLVLPLEAGTDCWYCHWKQGQTSIENHIFILSFGKKFILFEKY